MSEHFNISEDTALIVVDMQNDFLPGGSLPVAGGDQIISPINELSNKFYDAGAPVIFTQDWHPRGHYSFASSHPGKNPGDPIQEEGLGPILWPDHCVQNSLGAEINEKMQTEYAKAIIRKGYHLKIDSYSAFFDNDKKTKTGLAGYLRDLSIRTVVICGLALDYCCYYTAMDARSEGFELIFLKDLTRGIDQPVDNVQKALISMGNAGIIIH